MVAYLFELQYWAILHNHNVSHKLGFQSWIGGVWDKMRGNGYIQDNVYIIVGISKVTWHNDIFVIAIF